MEEKNELIKVTQLPVIIEKLNELSMQIDEDLAGVNELSCNEESRQEIKKLRTKYGNDFKFLDEKRKLVKNAVLAPYEAFENVFKKCVTEKYKTADAILKSKIDEVENGIKQKLDDETKSFFDEYATQCNVDFITYEKSGIKAALSDNPTKLKKQVKAFIDKIVEDLAFIDSQPNYQAEILVEYKNNLNAVASITMVNNRYKAIEEEKKRQEELAKVKEVEQEQIEKIEATVLESPVVNKPVVKEIEQEELYTLKFSVTATKEKLIELKKFLLEGNYKYE